MNIHELSLKKLNYIRSFGRLFHLHQNNNSKNETKILSIATILFIVFSVSSKTLQQVKMMTTHRADRH